jgi:hypothetical protein
VDLAVFGSGHHPGLAKNLDPYFSGGFAWVNH